MATILNEWLRGRREYDEARLLIPSELVTMRQIAQNVVDGRFTAEWAAAAIQTAAWETYQVRLVRRLSKHMATWGVVAGVYSAVDLLRLHPANADIAGLQRAADAAQTALSALTLRPLWPSPPRTPLDRFVE